MNKGSVMFNAPVPPGEHTFGLVEPCGSTFDFSAPAVAPQRSPVLRCCFPAVALVRRNQFNTMLCQPLDRVGQCRRRGHERKRAGRAAQHAPVRNTQKTTLSTLRSLCTSQHDENHADPKKASTTHLCNEL